MIMPSEPQDVLTTAYQALVARDAAAFAALVAPASEQELRAHLVDDLDGKMTLPSEAALAQAPIPPEMAKFVVDRVATARNQARRDVMRNYEISDAAGLNGLPLATLVAGTWLKTRDYDLTGLTIRPLGTVVENDQAHVLYRLVSGHTSDTQGQPAMATLRLNDDRWALLLDPRSPFLFPGLSSLFWRRRS